MNRLWSPVIGVDLFRVFQLGAAGGAQQYVVGGVFVFEGSHGIGCQFIGGAANFTGVVGTGTEVGLELHPAKVAVAARLPVVVAVLIAADPGHVVDD